MLQPQRSSSHSNTHYATATPEDAPYPHSSSSFTQPDDLSPRAHKRRRAEEPFTPQDIAAADHLELCDLLLTTNLPFCSPAGQSVARTLQRLADNNSSTPSRYVPHEQNSMANITDIYTLAHERMLSSVQNPHQQPGASSPHGEKYGEASEYGPYHAQYWSMVGGNLDSGIPVPSNGGYQSPYGSTAPEQYFPQVAIHSPTDSFGEMNQANGYDHPNGSIYTLGRNTQFSPSLSQQESANVYPSPVDNFSWNYFSSSVDSATQNITTLDSLATQMLNMLLSNPLNEVISMLSNESHQSQSFANLESMFESVARQLPHDTSNKFIDIDQVRLNSPESSIALRKANLAIFATCIFKGRDVPFMDLNNAFLDIFMPIGTCLLLNEGSMFLELKTQAFMAMSLGQSYPREYLDRLFPRDLQLTILRRRQDSHHLAATEQDFISRYNSRRQHLSTCCDDMEALNQLPTRFSWNDLLTELRICTARALEYLERAKPANTPNPSSESSQDPIAKAALAAHAAISNQSPLALLAFTPPALNATNTFPGHKRKHSSLNSEGDGSLSPESPHAPLHLQYRSHTHPGTKSTSPYSSSSSNRRLQPTPSARRPWTPDEEKALMDGLEKVRGPHWSQILALYGTNGSISEILKDRNQVQLKDKARNLKLFFLKSGMEVPEFLKKVTGELKTRAPAQAAKMEARERMRRAELSQPEK